MKRAAWFITIASIINILGFAIGLPEHLDEASWSVHAQFHHVLGWIWLLGLDITIITLAWGPLQRGERWSFWLLLVSFFSAQGGFFMAVGLVFEGRPPLLVHHLSLATVLLMYDLGLFFAWRALNASVAARN
jgi:hypothetical protein